MNLNELFDCGFRYIKDGGDLMAAKKKKKVAPKPEMKNKGGKKKC